MTTVEFQRAKTEEQRAQRRAHILEVTREMLQGRRIADLSFNEIARQVGLAKSDVMRYFGSREAILLTLLETEYDAWVTEMAASLPTSPETDPTERVAAVLAHTVMSRPLLCELLAGAPTVLEHNVTAQEVTEFKLNVQRAMARLMAVLAEWLGPWEDGRAAVFLGELHACVTHTWALANPSPALAAAYASCDAIQVMPCPPEISVREALATLLIGLKHRTPRWDDRDTRTRH